MGVKKVVAEVKKINKGTCGTKEVRETQAVGRVSLLLSKEVRETQAGGRVSLLLSRL